MAVTPLETMAPSKTVAACEAPASHEALPPYETIAIVGLGLMGGSLALALRRSGFQGRIRGVSRLETLAEAARIGIVDESYPYEELTRAAGTANLVVLASPISVILEHIRKLGKAPGSLRPGVVITDVGSTKRTVVRAAARHLPPHAVFIGGHPLAGSEARGLAAADPFLFQNAYYVLTPGPGALATQVDRLGRFLAATGARIMVLEAEAHDRVAAAISHLPQLLAVSLVRFLDKLGAHRDHGIRLAAGGFRDMTRIASSSFEVWRDIVGTNRDIIDDVLDRFLSSTRKALKGLSPKRLESEFEKAAATRAAIPRDSKGFLHRLHDVLVVVEDRPGTILGIARPLARKRINVKDIEILKVREGEGGTMRLAFETAADARRAIEILARHGYAARLRE